MSSRWKKLLSAIQHERSESSVWVNATETSPLG